MTDNHWQPTTQTHLWIKELQPINLSQQAPDAHTSITRCFQWLRPELWKSYQLDQVEVVESDQEVAAKEIEPYLPKLCWPLTCLWVALSSNLACHWELLPPEVAQRKGGTSLFQSKGKSLCQSNGESLCETKGKSLCQSKGESLCQSKGDCKIKGKSLCQKQQGEGWVEGILQECLQPYLQKRAGKRCRSRWGPVVSLILFTLVHDKIIFKVTLHLKYNKKFTFYYHLVPLDSNKYYIMSHFLIISYHNIII